VVTRRDLFLLATAWALLTTAGVVLVIAVPLFPPPAAQEARVIDGAMGLLTALSAPVFALVVVGLGYCLVRFRRPGVPDGDGPPLRGHLGLELTWVAVTLALVVFLAFYGSFSLVELRAHAEHEQDALVVQATGSQWFWEFSYPDLGVRTREALVLPVGQRVRFQVLATDVVHSFWVPAFRVKIDAVPGLVTSVVATPDRIGQFQQDEDLRVQCAELCGLGHGAMASPVVIVEPHEFQAWIAEQRERQLRPQGR